MDLAWRFSKAQAVDSANLAEAVSAFEALWVSQFCHPESIHSDNAFSTGEFKQNMEEVWISFRPVHQVDREKTSLS